MTVLQNTARKFARWVFLGAGIWGVMVLLPLYFIEGWLAINFPPAIAHPEYYYGFVGVALAWQVVFFIIASDVERYRLLMLPSILEKFAYGGSSLALMLTGRITFAAGGWGLIDLALGLTFVCAFLVSGTRAQGESA